MANTQIKFYDLPKDLEQVKRDFYSPEAGIEYEKYCKQMLALQKEIDEMAKLEVALLVGPESKAFLSTLTEQIDRLERMQRIAPPTVISVSAPIPYDDATADFGDDAAPEAQSSGLDAVFVDGEDDDDDFAAPTPAPAKEKKPKAPKKPTENELYNQVCDACAAKAKELGGGKAAREIIERVLLKSWGAKTISEIDPKHYSAVIEKMKLAPKGKTNGK